MLAHGAVQRAGRRPKCCCYWLGQLAWAQFPIYAQFDKPRPRAFKSDASIRHLMCNLARKRRSTNGQRIGECFLIANVNSHCEHAAIECVAFVRLNAKLKFQFDMMRAAHLANSCGVIRRPHPPQRHHLCILK